MAQGRVILVVDALNEMIKRGILRFPKEVMLAVVDKHDPATDSNLCIWIKTAWRLFDCKIEYNFKRDAQAWAQQNGYPDGLDSALGGRESCVVAIVAYLIKMQTFGKPCCVVTDDNRPVPGRAPLGEVCMKLDVPTVSPTDFFGNHVNPAIALLAEEVLFTLPSPDRDTVREGNGSEPGVVGQTGGPLI
jgi:hypothetical protein